MAQLPFTIGRDLVLSDRPEPRSRFPELHAFLTDTPPAAETHINWWRVHGLITAPIVSWVLIAAVVYFFTH